VLIIPIEPLVNAYEFTDNNKHIAGHMMRVAAIIAEQEGVTDGFRLIINNGKDSRQEVMHIHMHMLAGDDIGPMTCK
jgi:histidine triad (HIT) family protein